MLKLNRFALVIILIDLGCKSSINATLDSGSLTVNKVATSGSTSVSYTASSGSAYTSVTVDQGSDFLATNICSGTTIFGLTGTASCSVSGTSTVILLSSLSPSGAARNKGTTQITQYAESNTYAGTALPSNYRDVPDSTKDDNGSDNGTVSSANVTLASRPTTDCGMTGSITSRIADCASLNSSTSTWDGTVKANAGQGVWKLVSRIGANNEVWRDQNTNLLWSSRLSAGNGWCQAAGFVLATDGHCPANTLSYCAEVLAPSAVGDGNPGAWGTGANMYADQKGRMGIQSTPSIKWRLPSLYDYEQADIDGVRFVMPDFTGTEWTSTVWTGNVLFAISYSAGNSMNRLQRNNGAQSIRCVGR